MCLLLKFFSLTTVSPPSPDAALSGFAAFSQEFSRKSYFMQGESIIMLYDLTVVGGGPAGLTAAIYAVRSGLNTLLIETVSYTHLTLPTTERV